MVNEMVHLSPEDRLSLAPSDILYRTIQYEATSCYGSAVFTFDVLYLERESVTKWVVVDDEGNVAYVNPLNILAVSPETKVSLTSMVN